MNNFFTMSTKFCNYNLILYTLRLIYHRFIGQKLSKARHSLDELLKLKIHFFFQNKFWISS